MHCGLLSVPDGVTALHVKGTGGVDRGVRRGASSGQHTALLCLAGQLLDPVAASFLTVQFDEQALLDIGVEEVTSIYLQKGVETISVKLERITP